MPGVEIGKSAVIRRAILDKNVIVPPGATIGLDLDHDKQHYHVTDNGVVVLGKGQEVAT
jgi:glucose-1-phosphate adenylyltransferase